MPLDRSNQKDQASTRRLLLAKHMFLHGAGHAADAGNLNKILAIHHFHNALEIALKTVCTHYEISFDERTKFHELIGIIDSCAQAQAKDLRIPHKAKLLQLNRVRNEAQHDGLPPSDLAMNEGRLYADEALRGMCQSYFELNWDDLSPVGLIENDKLRDLLERSQVLFRQGKHDESIKFSYVAFVCASEPIAAHLTQDYKLPLTAHAPYHQYGNLDQQILFLLRTMQTLELNMILLHTGIHITDFRRFMELRPVLGFTDGGQVYEYGHHQSPRSSQDAMWFHDFVAEQIVEWQAQGFAPTISEVSRPTYEHLCKELDKQAE